MSTTGADLVKAVRELAEETPDFVYEPPGNHCVNIYEGKGSCIAGRAYVKAGIPVADIPYSLAVPSAVGVMGVVASMPEIDWLLTVQSAQDNGTPWGEAVAEADRLVELT